MNEDNNIMISEYLCRCKCCLNYIELKSLWEVHESDGGDEIYGNMVVECFGLPVCRLLKFLYSFTICPE